MAKIRWTDYQKKRQHRVKVPEIVRGVPFHCWLNTDLTCVGHICTRWGRITGRESKQFSKFIQG